MAGPALQMSGIVKTYGGVPVLKNVDFTVKSGEIHALLGENGAGKTTLMNILGGVTPMDSGEIKLFGERVSADTPGEMQKKGIAFIHQELNIVNDLTVYENMFLGYELKTRPWNLDVRKMCRETSELFERIHVQINPRAMMSELETSEKQLVEIAKSLLRNARIIIMDEPTTSLTQKEIDNVFQVMRTLVRSHGVTIIFISHKLGEVVEFCDSYTVLRNGEKVADGTINQENGVKIGQADIARMMVGRDVLAVDVYEPHTIGGPLLEVDSLSVGKSVKNISFTLRKGEVFGITGLLGDGKEQLVRSLFGDLPRTSGRVSVGGVPVDARHPAQGKKSGFGYVPSNRKENAIIKDLSVQSNITIVSLDKCSRGLSLSRKLENEMALNSKKDLSIKVTNLNDPITSLSGGNQQKVVLSKWLNARPQVLILSNPTQGVDVGAKNEIYTQIMKLAKQGIGIIIASGEPREIMKVCDRVMVMYHGEARGELVRGDFSEENIMILSTGGAPAKNL